MKNYVLFFQYLAEFFLEGEMFQTKFVEKIKIYFVFDNFFPKIVPLWHNGGKNSRLREATGDNVTQRSKYIISIFL
jgi:hypothetical protein